MIDSSRLKNFAQEARRQLMDEVRVRLDLALNPTSALAMENREAVSKLRYELDTEHRTKEEIVEEVAYTWFNRIIALRYMDSRGFQTPMAVTPLEGQSLPEMLTIAKSLDFSVFSLSSTKEEQIRNLVLGNTQSTDAQGEIYRILFLSVCNDCSQYMPEVFEWVGNYTEILLPDNLLSDNSVLMKVARTITDEDCENGNIIGWMYQYYISEKKDEVMASKKKYGKDEIPAATQLFTPEWIVRYLVQNSIGRLWMLNNPDSPLRSEMEYYVEPVEPETDFIRLSSPGDFKVLDPCCGSGHMLTYAFDLLYKIYEECGYTSSDAVESIIKNNLFGIEIDRRAGQLSYFALLMKASEKNRRFLRNKSKARPNICILENEHFSDTEIKDLEELFKGTLPINFAEVMNQFEHADILGSLITPCISDISSLESTLERKKDSNDLFNTDASLIERAERVFKQTRYLSKRYNIVITNPPYLDPAKTDSFLQAFAKSNYPNSKTDTGTMFIERNFGFIPPNGYEAMITLQSWMFSSTFEKLRINLTSNFTIVTLAQIGPHGFDMISGERVTTTTFVIKGEKYNCLGCYFKLTSGRTEKEKQQLLNDAISKQTNSYRFAISQEHFRNIPSVPIAFWVSTNVQKAYENETVSNYFYGSVGIQTSNNDKFIHLWWEPSYISIKFDCLSIYDTFSTTRWMPYNKGGKFRKWAGNDLFVVDWKEDGKEVKEYGNINGNHWQQYSDTLKFKPHITWSRISNTPAFRIKPYGYLSDMAGFCVYPKQEINLEYSLGFFNSNVANHLIKVLSGSSVNIMLGQVLNLPLVFSNDKISLVVNSVLELIGISKRNWNSFETSWNFFRHPLAVTLRSDDYNDGTVNDLIAEMQQVIQDGASYKLSDLYEEYKESVNEDFELLKGNEERLNKIFIDIYGLQDELKPEEDDSMVSVHKIFDDKSEIPEYMKGTNSYALTKEDVVKSLISYSVGCMFGRYSLDTGGLVYAGGEWDESKYVTFKPDNDNVIPVLDGDYFDDDITERFYKFLIAAYGKATFQENLRFVENALGMKVKDYFVKGFFKDHCSTYKNRPIYWIFSSPKGTFNALMYLHRYDRNTVQSMRNDYLLPFRAKLVARREELAGKANDTTGIVSAKEKLSATKQLDKLALQIKEIDDWERDIVYPQCASPIEIDLDDGVKVNYQKLGKVLKPIK